MAADVAAARERISVIIDTGIGGDIDDMWALAPALKSPEPDLRTVLTDTGYTAYRSEIVARMLAILGRTDGPVGIGIHLEDKTGPQARWVEAYALSIPARSTRMALAR